MTTDNELAEKLRARISKWHLSGDDAWISVPVREVRALDCLASRPPGDGEQGPWRFDRYVGGRLMAEGVRINRASSLDEAMQMAVGLIERDEHETVLVLRSPVATPIPAELAETVEQERLVIVESPYAGDIARNEAYARAAMADCLRRAEAPIASHLLYTQPGVLDDGVQAERNQGINAGLAWARVANAAIFYVDFGWSSGMRAALLHHTAQGRQVETRTLEPAILDHLTRGGEGNG